ncbi:MAG: potassium transporter Kup [Hyphomicrobiales bacterium]
MQTSSSQAEASDPADLQHHSPETAGHGLQQSLAMLALGAIGVVYGDIGTSPIYAFRESVRAAMDGATAASPDIVLGILSLMALAQRGRGKFYLSIPILGMIGAALFYGDAAITPAISVLSAVEGLGVITPAFTPYVLPLTLAILIVLFAVQSRGTASVATLFGPVTLVWFAALAASGVMHIIAAPQVLAAFNPLHAVSFLTSHGKLSLLTMGAVFLAVTGGEALYADLGHFGKSPIRLAWFSVVLPALLLNYLGQGALLLQTPQALDNPFFLMMPAWALLPIVLLATAATIIASQAVITGAYSMTRQAIQLGLMPRMPVAFTSAATSGQIYMSLVNWALLAAVILLVLAFGSSSALASAYGIAVSGTMVVTTLLAMFVLRNRWKWSYPLVYAVMLPLLAVDASFLFTNSLKVVDGGWVPLLIGLVMMALMWAWRQCTRTLRAKDASLHVPLKDILASLEKSSAKRVAGTAVFLTSDLRATPPALLHAMKHFQVLHGENVVAMVEIADTPQVPPTERLRIEPLAKGFWQARLKFGYLEQPDVPKALRLAKQPSFANMRTTYVLSRRNLKRDPLSTIPAWQALLYILLSRNADDASNYFALPPDRVVELGSQQGV